MTAAPVPAAITDRLAVKHESSRAWRYLRANRALDVAPVLIDPRIRR